MRLGLGLGLARRRGGATPETISLIPEAATTVSGFSHRILITFDANLENNTGTTVTDWVATDTSLHSTKRTQSPYSVDNTGSNNTVLLYFNTPFFEGGTLSVAYTASSNPLTGAASETVDDFTGFSVTNLSSIPVPSIYVDLKRSESFTTSLGLIDSLINMVTATSYADTDGTKPDYDATGLGGLPCAVGNGSSKRIYGTLDAAHATALSAEDVPYTHFMVIDPVTADAFTVVVGFYLASLATTRQTIGSNTVGGGRYTSRKLIAGAGATATRSVDVGLGLQSLYWFSTGTAASLYVNKGPPTAADPSAAAQNVATLSLDGISFLGSGPGVSEYSPAKLGVYMSWIAQNLGTDTAATDELHTWAQDAWGVALDE